MEQSWVSVFGGDMVDSAKDWEGNCEKEIDESGGSIEGINGSEQELMLENGS
jgi:hypothetical protein